MIVLNCACFVGKRINGWRGMFCAALGAILPAFVLMLIATILYSILPMTARIQSAFLGIRAASSAMILTAAITLYQHNIRNQYGFLIMLVSVGLLFILNFSAPLVLLIAGLFGFVYYRFGHKGVKNDLLASIYIFFQNFCRRFWRRLCDAFNGAICFQRFRIDS